ncbi:unnamed protein product [Cylindrotheca closterium]|uniref:Methyltransferase type 11 domain-containing protein n=1 Tax=Cylindrotheca closterium TaxID=2856 RepID=A0AAD2CJQ7_9STRA|nr:unnamed protein product [Cylindrotheca closterium]
MMFSHRTVLLLAFVSTVANAFSLLSTSSPSNRHYPLISSSSPRSFFLQAATLDAPEVTEDPKAVKEEEKVPQSPGLREDSVFDCDGSVQYWKDFQSEGNDGNLQRLVQILSEEANTDNLARAYWASHLLRTGYFTMNAALGSVFSDVHERFIASRDSRNAKNKEENTENISPIFANDNDMTNRLINSDIPSRLLLEAFRVYYQDYQYVKDGLLKFPWDALVQSRSGIQLNTNHRQSNPIFALQETAASIFESVAIFSRRNKQSSKGVFLSQPKKSDDVGALLYPDYYLNDFHYQTDGWLSSKSAQRYESSTETLFLGRQDAMQRQTLIPILQSASKPTTMLEVAAGTGRFGTFVRDHFPTANMTYTDLSPFYLEKAQENDKYWMEQRGQDALKEAGVVVSEKRKPEPATFVQANAEDLPFPDNSFDAVTSVYLFHELPKKAQQKAAKEMVRVVKPGGMIVFTDSIQKGDRPPLDAYMGNFGKLNEPHYDNYIETYLPDLFEGCEMDKKFVASSTKTLSFIKK